MAKQLNVNLAFTADTGKAKAQIKELQSTLDKLMLDTSTSGELGLTKDLVKARGAAADLKVALQSATTSTGSIDLSKLNDAFKRSGKDLSAYRMELEKLGPQGQQAFLKLSQSIITAEAPLKRTSALLNEFKTTLANTVRWQISSSVLHGFMGAISSAYNYAQDLNESLNNIRIVTGQNTEQMARFAEQANQAAKALNTTTTAYTNAALIYYQQGDDDSTVLKKTDVTAKMANVTGQDASVVSDQLTAIWNNFNKSGEESYEKYADILTALGAATASSTDEIAGGLEKFASVADMIGLSYEYAASALATITATTRQSEDVVGTALKTIFARIQGLSLGETLEDGTDLNKYSQALDKVGISIKDANGEMKDMDTILEEMGAKWQTLGKDQQIALAQTVAGVRQYNQLVSLMDNWDFMEKNLATARNATGTLNEQAEIYGESWEAAQKRVQAALQGIYNTLLDDDFFIGISNGFATVVTGIEDFINALGGLRGVIPGVVLLINKLFGDSIAKGIDNVIFNIRRLTPAFQEEQEALRQKAFDEAMNLNTLSGTEAGDAKVHSLKTQIELQNQLRTIANEIDAEDLAELQNRLDIVNAYRQQVEEKAKLKDKASDNLQDVRKGMVEKAQRSGNSSKQARVELKKLQEMEAAATQANGQLQKLDATFAKDNNINDYINGLKQLKQQLLDNGFTEASGAVKRLKAALDNSGDIEKFKKIMHELAQEGEFADRTFMDIDNVAGQLGERFNWTTVELDDFRQSVAQLTQAGMTMDDAIEASAAAINDFKQKAEEAKASANALGTTGQTITQAFSGISQVAMGLSSLVSVFETLANPDMTGFEKFKTVLMSLITVVPSLTMGLSALATMNKHLHTQINLATAAESKNLIVKGMSTAATWLKSYADKAEEKGIRATVAAKISELMTDIPLLAITLALVAAVTALVGVYMLLSTAIKLAVDQYNKDAIAAEKAAAAAKGLADTYAEAKTKYEEMIAAMENYKTARDGLDSLTKGTEEYADALKEANKAALDLIEKAPSLRRGEDYDWKNGELVINNDAMERIQKEEQKELTQFEAASIMADAKSRQASAKASQTRAVRSDDVSGWEAAAVGAASGTGVGILGGPATAAISALIGAGITAANAGAQNATDNAIQNDQVDSLIEKYKLLGDAAFDAATLEELGFDTANQTYINAIKDVVKETVAASEDLENASRMSTDLTMSNNESYANSKNKDKIANVGGRVQQELYDAAYDEFYKQTKNKDLFGIGSDENKQAMEQYAQQVGLTELNGYKVTNFKRGGNVEYEYIDEEGKKQTKEVTREQIAMQLAAAQAAEKLGAETDRLVQTFNRLEESSNKADQALADFLGGKMQDSTNAEFSKMAADMGVERGGEITVNQAGKYLNAQFGGEDGIISNEEAKVLGYESAQKMREAFVEGFNATSGAWEDVNVPPTLSKNIAEGLSLATAQALENSINTMDAGPMGEQAGETFVAGLNNMLADVDPEEQQAAMDALTSIDWSDWDAMEQADAILKEFGVDIDTTSEDWKLFAANMRIANGAIPDFSTLKETLTEISGILHDLDFGSIIDEEDYQKLVEYNDEWEKFFILQADGSRKFIGDSDAMLQATRDQINEERKALEERKNTKEGFEKTDWSNTDWKDKKGSDTETAQNLLNATGATEDMLELLGYSDEILSGILEKATEGTAEEITAAQTQLEEMYGRIEKFQNEDLAAVNADLNEMFASTAKNISELNGMLETGDIDLSAYNKRMSEFATEIANSATTLQELNTGLGQLGGSSEVTDQMNYDEYAQGLLNIASQYESCSEAAQSYQNALNALSTATDENREAIIKQVQESQNQLEALIGCEEAAKKYGLEVDTLTAQMGEIAHEQGISKKEALQLAVTNERMNRGVASLVNNWSNWKKILKSVDRTAEDYAATLADVSDAVQELVGWYDDLNLNSEFVEENMDLIDKAAKGDVTAILELGAAVASYEVAQAELNTTLAEGQMADGTLNALQQYAALLGEGTTAAEAFASAQSGVQAGFDAIRNNLDALQNNTVSLADVLGGEQGLQDWVNQLNAYAAATGMTAEQMQQMLSSVGVTANVQSDYQEQEITVPTYTDQITNIQYQHIPVTRADGSTGEAIEPIYTRASVPGPPLTTTGYVEVASISMDGVGEAPGVSPPTFTGKQAPSNTAKRGGTGNSPGRKGSGGGGGGGGKSTPAKPVKFTKKSDIVDRYKEQNDILDDIEKELEDINKQSDRAFGLTRLKQMDKEQASLLKQKKALEDKAKVAKENLEIDKKVLKQTAEKHGLNFEFDDEKNISNYTTELTKLYDQLHVAEVKMSGMSTKEAQDEFKESTITPIEDKIEEIKDLIDQYDETKELLEDLEDEIDDAYYAWQDSNYEELTYRLELKIEVNDADLKKLDYYLNKYSDNFYKMAESAELLNKQIPELKEALNIYDDHKAKLDQAYANGEISQEAYINGLKEVRDGYYENLEALIDLDKQMLHYYEDTLSEARSELDDFTDHMEHLTEVFDHYLNLLDILGRSKDFEAMNDFLSGKAETLRDRLDVAKEYYEMLLGQKADAEQKLNAAIAAGDDAAAELYKEEWDAIVDEVDAAQEEVLSLTEEWAEAMKAVIENNMAEIADTLEKTLTGGTTFDTLMDEFDKLNTRQEEYLTKTNQIYETNKLMRTASKVLDETDNKVAKQKLKNFIDETKSLQENTKLSKYELEIQQAKYDLLLAEIALEEAKNAKSTVRLSRDSEGNFGYVYTADQDKVDDAQQAYEDADNRLYNLSLEGQQEFTEKYLQATQEMYNQLTELQQAWLNGEITSEEEYERRKEEILNHYLGPEGVLTTYQNLYNIAVRTDADATADNWQKDYGAMTQNTEDWKDAVNKYLVAVEEQTAQWAEVSEQANEDVEGALNDSATATEELTDESENLKDMINEEVIPAIEDELDWVKEQTEAYAEQREELLALIDAYEDYIDTIDKQIEKEAGIKYDKNTDYSALMMGYLAAGGSKDDNQFKELQKQREAKIDGEGYTKEKYGTRGSEFINNIEKNNTWYKDKDAVNKKLKELGIQTFATGGYTGDWGPEGKLAILHEKELILNARDTANLLSTISFIRDLVSLIDSQATSASLYNLMSTPGVTTSQEVLEQKVEIHAEFPNATDHNEIEEAFNNLVNRASQYANRK